MVVSEQMVTALATAAFPTFAETNRHIDDVKDVLRAEMFRIEQVFDARLKPLEEHL